MRSNLDDKGRMHPPRGLFEALERRAQLSHELRKVETQLRDEERKQAASHGAYADYLSWRQGAEGRLRLFREEQRQLAAYIEQRKDIEQLLREAWRLLKHLQGEVDFEEEEIAIVSRLDRYFGTPEISAPEARRQGDANNEA